MGHATIEELAKRERDAILLYFWEDWHSEKEKSDYLLEELIIMYKIGASNANNDNAKDTNED